MDANLVSDGWTAAKKAKETFGELAASLFRPTLGEADYLAGWDWYMTGEEPEDGY